VKTPHIEAGSPWKNAYIESIIGKLRDESLNQQLPYTLSEVKVLTKRWRKKIIKSDYKAR
jgi:putative transposase